MERSCLLPVNPCAKHHPAPSTTPPPTPPPTPTPFACLPCRTVAFRTFLFLAAVLLLTVWVDGRYRVCVCVRVCVCAWCVVV